MSYVDATGSLTVAHFVSDEVRQYQSTQSTKLMEAMTKLHSAITAHPGRYKATPGLLSYQAQYLARTPTSPAYNKRQQISHHVDTVSDVV